MTIDASDLLARFLSYVQIDTQSDQHSAATPSTPGQWDLIRNLEQELKALGLADVRVTEFGYVLATVPATTKKANVPVVAFFAHVDTADSCSGLAKPIVHRKYNGQPIVLPDDPKQILSIENTPLLKDKIGEDIITASGTTLLGADDKSGIAIIMAAVRHMLQHPEIPHGTIRVCFNPDEEIGRGTEKIELSEIGAAVAYTLDADHLGEVDYESFSADRAAVDIYGVATHPGWAKGAMVNAMRIAAQFIDALPAAMSPEHTSGREGFIHPAHVSGSSEHVRVEMLLRDFELDGLAAKRKHLEDVIARLRAEEPRVRIELDIQKQYRNMRYWLEGDMRPVEFAMEAVRRVGLVPVTEPIRGGTDGSRLTERGLPTPNLFTGFHYVHSEREWVSVQDMCKAAETVVELAKLWEEKA
ncbi:MAG: peptidase T [Planctomycetota bacterium]